MKSRNRLVGMNEEKMEIHYAQVEPDEEQI